MTVTSKIVYKRAIKIAMGYCTPQHFLNPKHFHQILSLKAADNSYHYDPQWAALSASHDAFHINLINYHFINRSENFYAQSDFFTLSDVATGRGSH